ncbi:MAG: hypothetical protein WB471_00075 [Nocardioides sp.]
MSLPPEPADSSGPTAAAGAHPGGTETSAEAGLRAERDALQQRLDETEEIAEQLAEELGQARARLAEAEAASNASSGRLPLFDDATDSPDGLIRSVDGSDRLLLPIALAATALVVLLVALLSLANNGFLSLFSIGSLLAAGLLGRAAWATRIVPVEVWVDRGVVLVRRGDASLNFDLTSSSLRCDIQGVPGDMDWRVRFYRRGLEPCDIDASMVDADAFMEQLRRYRPSA